MGIACSWSGGKESALAFHKIIEQGKSVDLLVNFISKTNKRCCFHGLPKEVILAQAGSIGVELLQWEMDDGMEEYEQRFIAMLEYIKPKGIEKMVFGDIYLDEHKDWVERVCGKMSVEALEPLWGAQPEQLIGDLVKHKFKPIAVSCKEELGEDFVGRVIDKSVIDFMNARGMCPCGEHGEYHTLITSSPFFSQEIKITKFEKVLREGFWKQWFLDVQDFELT